MRWRALLRSASGITGLVIVAAFLGIAVFAPFLAPKSPSAQDLRTALRPPGAEGYVLGSDELGRDTLSRIIYGSRISLAIGAAAVAFGIFVGIPLGVISGYYGGITDSITMRTSDILLAIPRLLLGIVIVATWGIGFWTLVLAIGFPDVPIFARLVRGSVLTISRMEYATAARAMGSPDIRIMARHIVPNLIGPIAVQSTFSMASAILTAGGLSFLGLGVRPPTPEWGYMLAQARTYMRVAPHLITFPGLALALVVLGINLLGDALRQAYDPRFRGKEG
jgi:ABC-type dipeptide/oligopeptide/nickel transport system permease subunit